MTGDLKYPTITEVPFNGRLIKLGSPSSTNLRLEGVAQKVIAWEPEGKEAFQVEVRARLQSNNAATEDFPIVRWFTEISAGEAVWREPFETRSDEIQQDAFVVPARGMVWRTGARQFRITFFADGTEASSDAIQTLLQVTILPVWGTEVDTYPYADTVARSGDGKTHPFPMTAREWRVFDVDGVPFAPAANGVAFIGLNGIIFPALGIDASLFGDWQPIPFEAVGWSGGDGTYVAFR